MIPWVARRLYRTRVVFAFLVAASCAPAASHDEFARTIRPVLLKNCSPCHNPQARINFLKAGKAKELQADRGLWRDVAAQLRNRTMPPVASALEESDRVRIATWIDNRLRQTACSAKDFAGTVAIRRLNRREYRNTVRDLLGVDFDVSEIFPADGTGGAGFDTNGETLFIPPLLMERYLAAAQQIVDRAIVTPNLVKTVNAAREVKAGEDLTVPVSIYVDGRYDVRVTIERRDGQGTLALAVDGAAPIALQVPPPASEPPAFRLELQLARGLRSLSVSAQGGPVKVVALTVEQRGPAPDPQRAALHYRLLGIEPGAEPIDARKAAEQTLRSFLRKAYRRPVDSADLDPILQLYDRAAARGDPFEERMKLAIRGVLVWPDFLFKMEQRSDKPGVHPLGQHELASRLSYFLWSTMPDEELRELADENRLQDPKVLTAQVDRLLDDPRSRTFTATFIGQWLGTQDLGGRLAPMLSELQSFYNPPVAADLRAEPVLIFERILREDRSLLELLDGNYTYLTPRLVKFYQLEDRFPNLTGEQPRLVEWPDHRRAGVMTLGSIMAMTSHYHQTSPVLRGAWVLDTLLGTPVPPPPPDIPPLDAASCGGNCADKRARVLAHRANPACSACHKLMDPIGFALENFDWNGRWRDREVDNSKLDTSGSLPSGEKFDGPVELRAMLLNRKEDFLRQLTGKVLAYALGRSLQDGDSCTVQRLADALERDHYRARTLIREVVMSVPFRNSQGGAVKMVTAAPPPKRTKPLVMQ